MARRRHACQSGSRIGACRTDRRNGRGCAAETAGVGAGACAGEGDRREDVKLSALKIKRR